jgi:hypothetical protein
MAIFFFALLLALAQVARWLLTVLGPPGNRLVAAFMAVCA